MLFMFESSESSDEENKEMLRVQRKVIRRKSDIFVLPDSTFVEYFRLNKTAFKFVLKKIEPLMRSAIRSSSISNTLKLATTLRFLAQGSYQSSVGNEFNLGLSQPTVSLILEEMLDVLERVICPLFIKFEMTAEEKAECKLYFFEKTGFPGIIGCIDGSHIKIQAPKKDDQNMYYNRKGFFSLNAMLICDHRMRIRYVDARYAGSSHDSLVWNVSPVRQVLRERYESGERNSWLLGDAGYPLEPYLMTPYRSAQERSPEAVFNSKHATARNIVERTFGVLKNRLRCLLGARQLHYSPSKATKIVNVCAALHNVFIEYRTSIEDYVMPTNTENSKNIFDTNPENSLNNEASQIRDQIKNLFL